MMALGPNRLRREAETKAEKGTISGALDTVGSVAAAISSVPIIGPFAGGISVVTKAASSVAEWFGFAKVPNLSIPQFSIVRSLPSQLPFDGVTNAEPFSINQVPFVATEAHLLASDHDTCNLLSIAQAPSLVAVASTVANPTDPQLLLNLPVRPTYSWKPSSSVNMYQNTNVGHVARCFRLWRGEMAYKIIIPGNALVRTRLVIAYTLEDVVSYSEEMRFVYVEVNGSKTIEFTVPWTRKQPYGDVAAYGAAGTYNGRILVWQLAPNTGISPIETPTPTNLLVFASATANTQFAQPVDGFRSGGYYSTTIPAAGLLGFARSQTITGLTAEDNIVSSREILHQYIVRSDVSIPVGVSQVPAALAGTPYSYFSRRYRFMRGSVRYRFIYLGEPGPIVRFTRNSDNKEIYWFTSEAKSFEVLAPFYSLDGFKDVTTPFDALFINVLGATAATPMQVQWALNDDLSFGVTVPTPFVRDAVG